MEQFEKRFSVAFKHETGSMNASDGEGVILIFSIELVDYFIT